MHLFLDANVYLSFYRASNDDLEQLDKLAVAVRSHTTVLFVTDQVRDEFVRNRGSVIRDALAMVHKAELKVSFPRFFTTLDGFDDLQATAAEYERQRKSLLQSAESLARARDLRADVLITELFDSASRVPLTSELWARAQQRHLLGNPPGKPNSMGDAVNWESLLETVPDGQDLDLVTTDLDYMSGLDPSALNEFLAAEWAERKRSVVRPYDRVGSLFKDRYPQIKLAADLDRRIAVEALASSSSYAHTHAAIRRLSTFEAFNEEDLRDLLEGLETNGQVSNILADTDVWEFYAGLAERYPTRIPADRLRVLRNASAHDAWTTERADR